MTLNDPRMAVLGGEPVRIGGAVVGRVTSGGFGYTVGKSIAFGYLPVDCAAIGTEVAVDIFGQWVPGRVEADQLHDPRGLSIRA
jgi:4-methylaminobutanoate oxidase (formaldehyde-forming)